MLSRNHNCDRFLFLSLILLFLAFNSSSSLAQGTSFTYQGKLSDSGAPANGAFDLQFKLFDDLLTPPGNQQGPTLTLSSVTVTGGVFAVTLDFGGGVFTGANRFLEIAVRPAGVGGFTLLSPRQPVTSNPYAIKSLNSTTADGLSVACINCVTSSQIQSVSGSQVNGAIPVASVPAGSDSYVQNTTTQQTIANFNISGTGTANILNAATQFDSGLNRVLTVNGLFFTNTFVGVQAGNLDPSGNFNSFFGNGSGKSTTTGANNSFYGSGSGLANQSGSDNAFFGRNTGFGSTGSQNSFFGSFSGAASSNTTNGNSFFGYQSGAGNTTGNENSFFGLNAGQSNTSGGSNAFSGSGAGQANTTGSFNTFIGSHAGNFLPGLANTTGSNNTFIGAGTGASNTTGSNNTILGANGFLSGNNLQRATAIGAGAFVSQSNSIVLGQNDNVGINAPAPVSRLHISDSSASLAVTFTNGANTAGRQGYRLAFDNDRFSFQRADDSGNFAANQVSIDQATGNVGIGTVSPDRTLTVNGTADKLGGGSWDVFSDERLKIIKGSFVSGLKAVMELQPIRYEYKPDNALGLRSSGEHIGFGAQAVQKIIPEAVTQNDKGYLLVNNDPILWTMLNAIKEQQHTIETLQQENGRLKARNAETETRLISVETSVRRMAQESRRRRRLR